MATYDADLQAVVDATSIAQDAGETDLETYLRSQLTQRDIETADDEWVAHVVASIKADPNYMIDREPTDYTSTRNV